MTFALAFWVLMLIWLALGLWLAWPSGGIGIAPNLLLFLLLLLLGWHAFGPPLVGH